MIQVYVYNDWHAGDQLTNRCLVRAIVERDCCVTVGAFQDHAYLYADLGVGMVTESTNERDRGTFSLRFHCPSGHVPIDGWCGRYPDLDQGHCWRSVVDSYHQQVDEHKWACELPVLNRNLVPMVDFVVKRNVLMNSRSRCPVYLENGPTRSGHSAHQFDLEKLSKDFPLYDFYCTAKPGVKLDNVWDCSEWNLVDLSVLSDLCAAILGKGSGPFIATMTVPNALKPRAVVGYSGKPIWPYPNSPLEYLEPGQEYDFLRRI